MPRGLPRPELPGFDLFRHNLPTIGIASCALSQIRSWKFPPISGGLTTFQAPFVFTPPH